MRRYWSGVVLLFLLLAFQAGAAPTLAPEQIAAHLTHYSQGLGTATISPDTTPPVEDASHRVPLVRMATASVTTRLKRQGYSQSFFTPGRPYLTVVARTVQLPRFNPEILQPRTLLRASSPRDPPVVLISR